MTRLIKALALLAALVAPPALAQQEPCCSGAVATAGGGYDPGCYGAVLDGRFPVVDAATGDPIGMLPYARGVYAYSSDYRFDLGGGYQPPSYPPAQQPPVYPPAQQPGVSLAGTSWRLVSLNGAPVMANTTLNFEAGGTGFGGTAPCNTYGGDYQILSGFGIDLGNVFATRRACPQLPEEQAYFAALDAAEAFRLGREGDQLALLNAAGKVIARFERAGSDPTPPSNALLGSWRVLSAVGELPPGGAQNENASITFRADGTFGSELGCNIASGRYALSGGTLTLNQIAVTARACIVPAKFESALLAAFPRVRSFQAEMDGSVTFRDAGGAILFTVAR